MTQLLPNIFAIEVPEGSKDHGLVHIYAGEDILYWVDKKGEKGGKNIDANAYSLKILFTTQINIEEKASKFIRGNSDFFEWWGEQKYTEPFTSAGRAFQSLLRSKGLTAGNYLIIKKTG